MSKNVKKFLLLLFIILSLLAIIPVSFAQNNDTVILNEQSLDMDSSISLNDGVIASSSNDYYFDISADRDGDGSQSNPYKFLKDSRILNNSVIHIAKGEYDFESLNPHTNVSIYGDNSIIRCNGTVFFAEENLLLKDITFVNTQIMCDSNLMAFNVVFTNVSAAPLDGYNNSFGGAVYCMEGDWYRYAEGCTFENTSAEYGGAIYAQGGILEIKDSVFNNCTSYGFGGAIACVHTSEVSISKSRFNKCNALSDAGGAIYIMFADFNADNLEIDGCSATFGGAITTLGVNANLNKINCVNNTAKWDGGAIYHVLGNFTLTDSIFNGNSASNGGALYADSSSNLTVTGNDFIKNTASQCGGAIYSIFNDEEVSGNTYSGNSAKEMNDEYISTELSLIVVSDNYAIFRVNPVEIDELPSRYSLDDEGYVTAVKNQQNGGNCWAFSAMTVLESCILKAANVTYDLSEENLKNIASLFSDYGWNSNPNDGGNTYMLDAYLLNWFGAVNESDDPYDDYSALSPLLNSTVHVQNVLFLYRDNYTDNDAIKEAILKYGPVGSNMLMEDMYFNENTNGYYCNDENVEYTNHGVTIIGWDDNYSRYNFNETPEGDGAWIVRNSWGSEWGDNGNFYISYYDVIFTKPKERDSFYTFILNDTIRYNKNYQYDLGKTGYMPSSFSSVMYKNIFTSTDDEFLAAVSTYFEKTTDWTVNVNVNGESKVIKSGTSDNGYFTIALDELVPLKKGDVFEVVFNITVDGDCGFPVSEQYENTYNHKFYTPGISYVSWDGITWTDLYDYVYVYEGRLFDSQVACIKAFTVLNPIETFLSLNISHNFENPVSIVANVVDEYGNPLNYGTVTLNLEGADHVLNVSEGKASMQYSFDNVLNVVYASFNATGYSSSYSEKFVVLTKTEIYLDLEISQLLDEATLDISCLNKINETLIITINDNPTEYRLVNGKAKYRLTNLSNGVYNVNITLPKTSQYECDALIDSFVVNVSKTQIIAKDLTFGERDVKVLDITLVDEAKTPLANRLVNVEIGNYSFAGFTDENGIYRLPMLLGVGEYVCDINFNGDDIHLKSHASVNVLIKKSVKNQTQVLIDIGEAEIDEDVDVNINVPGAAGEVLVFYNGQSIPMLLDNNGKTVLTIEKIGAGVHIVDVVYLGDENHEMANSSEVIVVSRLTSTIDLTIGEPRIGVATPIDIEIPKATGEVLVFVDGVEYHKTLADGKAKLTVDSLAIGNHDVVVFYAGDEVYDSAYSNTVVSGTAVKSKFANIAVSGSGTVTAVLTDEDEMPLSNMDIVYAINGVRSKTKTDSAGKLTIAAASNTLVEIYYDGTDVILPVNVSLTLKDLVKPRIATEVLGEDFTQPAIEYGIGERGGNFTVQLVDLNSKPLANKLVYIGYNGKCLNRTTDNNGYASVRINLLAENRLTFAVAFLGDEDCDASMSVYLITVTKKPVTISAPAKTYKASAKTKSYTVTLKTDKNKFDGKTYFGSKKQVTLVVNGKTYTAKTNDNGQATFKLSITKKGTYTATVTYQGDSTYSSAKATAKIKIS